MKPASSIGTPTAHCLAKPSKICWWLLASGKAYKVAELVGCQVVTDLNEVLGILVDVLPSGGNDIFVVRQGMRETLIPALQSVVQKVDVAAKRIEVTLPQGLREIYEET